jgi:hypothetical protein
MAKVVISLGWKKYVVDAQQAVAVAEMLSKAEVYETKYVKDGEDKSTTMYYVYPQEDEHGWMMEIMPDSIYRMAKLAGKPEKD